jgi:arylsulfatase A-like enzyme
MLGAGVFSAAIPDVSWPRAAKRPNVLFIALDDMNDWISSLGGYSEKVHTPNFDRLGRKGITFTNAHSPSTICNPSRTAIMTGLRPSTTTDNGGGPHYPML